MPGNAGWLLLVAAAAPSAGEGDYEVPWVELVLGEVVPLGKEEGALGKA